MNFDQRLSSGQAGQQDLVANLRKMGFRVMLTGQEMWLDEVVHQALRLNHTDQMMRAVRYRPDLLAYHPGFPLAYWEVKTNTTPGTANFAVEKACYAEMVARKAKGERIVFAFQDVDRTWYAQWVEKLIVARDMSAIRKQARGSHTPYLLIPKSCVLPLSGFLKTFGTSSTT